MCLWITTSLVLENMTLKNVIIDKIPDTLQFTNPGDKKLTFNFKTNEDNQI